MTAEPWQFDPAIDPRAFEALGFAATSVGIASRQREYREGWWSHAQRSKAFILDAAARARPHPCEGTQGGTVAVLGAGKAYDLPLAELARGFERVVLVDIDARALEETAAATVKPAALRAKLELRPMDLTGVGARLARAIQAAADAAPDGPALQAAYESLCASYRLAAPALLFPRRVDLVVSALVLTQLANPLKLLAKALFERRFGAVPQRDAARWVAAWDALDLRMQADHVAALAGSARLVALTSEVMHRVTRLDGRGQEQLTGEAWPLAGERGLDTPLPPGAEVLARAAWQWPRIRPLPDRPGARMDVEAVLLRDRDVL